MIWEAIHFIRVTYFLYSQWLVYQTGAAWTGSWGRWSWWWLPSVARQRQQRLELQSMRRVSPAVLEPLSPEILNVIHWEPAGTETNIDRWQETPFQRYELASDVTTLEYLSLPWRSIILNDGSPAREVFLKNFINSRRSLPIKSGAPP